MSANHVDAADPEMVVSPGYLAGPGDPEAALANFLDAYPSWNGHSIGQDTTVAAHEQLKAFIELNHEAAGRRARWTIAFYESPVGQRAWQATFSPRTPVEVVMAVARQLSYGLAHSTDVQRFETLWGRIPKDTALQQEVAQAEHWQSVSTEHQTTHSSPDGTTGLITHNSNSSASTGSQDLDVTCTVWGGPRGYEDQRWQARFTRHVPTTLVTAALNEVTQPLPNLRRASQIPAANRTQVDAVPRFRRRVAATARTSAVPTTTSLTPAAASGPSEARPATRSR